MAAHNNRIDGKQLNKAFSITASALLILVGFVFAPQAGAQTNIAFSNPAPLDPNGLQTAGSQTGGPFALGLEFSVVNKPITITALGAFDSTIGNTGAGFSSIIYVGIYNEATSSFVGNSAAFLANVGHTAGVVDSYQFQSINALTLDVGTYVVIAAGYSGTQNNVTCPPDWNADLITPIPSTSPIHFDNGSGDLTLGNALYANDPNGQLEPTPNIGTGPAPVFGAGSFEYTVPEPSTTELAFVGAALVGAVRFGRRFFKR